jgi:hypothetical protein
VLSPAGRGACSFNACAASSSPAPCSAAPVGSAAGRTTLAVAPVVAACRGSPAAPSRANARRSTPGPQISRLTGNAKAPSLFRDLAYGLDAVAFAEDRLGFAPDPWQSSLLRSQSRQVILNCCRQSGKSTVSAIVALHTALFEPGALLISPSQRQSRELFAKVMEFLRLLEPVEELREDNKLSAMLANRSRLVSLPGDPPNDLAVARRTDTGFEHEFAGA